MCNNVECFHNWIHISANLYLALIQDELSWNKITRLREFFYIVFFFFLSLSLYFHLLWPFGACIHAVMNLKKWPCRAYRSNILIRFERRKIKDSFASTDRKNMLPNHSVIKDKKKTTWTPASVSINLNEPITIFIFMARQDKFHTLFLLMARFIWTEAVVYLGTSKKKSLAIAHRLQ